MVRHRRPSPVRQGARAGPRRSSTASELAWDAVRRPRVRPAQVPLDYDRPAAAPRARRAAGAGPATGRRVGSLVVNPGGPGRARNAYAAAAPGLRLPSSRTASTSSASTPAAPATASPSTASPTTELDGYVAADPTPDDAAEADSSSAVMTSSARAASAVGRRAGGAHLDRRGRPRHGRAALGARVKQLDYFGASYGTKLGATYAELFPSKVGRFVLDGAVDVSLTSARPEPGAGRGFETALRAYVDELRRDHGRLLPRRLRRRRAGPDHRLPRRGRRRTAADAAGSGAQVGNAFYGIVAPLYNRDTGRS